MGIDGTARDQDTPDDSDTNAERTTRTQTSTNDSRTQPQAETRTREEYANASRADRPSIRPGSPDAPRSPNGSGPGDREDADDADGTADPDSPGLNDREKDSDTSVTRRDGSDHTEATRAEPRTREEYADAVREKGMDDGDRERSAGPGTEPASDASGTAATVRHYHSEFKDLPLDLYTDGTRWAAADTPRSEETISEKGDIPPDRLPTGEELVDSAGEGSSLLERLRHGVYEESDDETDILEKDANTFHDVFSHPPASSYEGTPAQPHVYETPHSGIDAGSAATALFVFGLVIDRAVHWAMGYYDKHAEES
jgi:hypothetical protein